MSSGMPYPSTLGYDGFSSSGLMPVTSSLFTENRILVGPSSSSIPAVQAPIASGDDLLPNPQVLTTPLGPYTHPIPSPHEQQQDDELPQPLLSPTDAPSRPSSTRYNATPGGPSPQTYGGLSSSPPVVGTIVPQVSSSNDGSINISSKGDGYVSHFPGPPIQTSKNCQGPDGCNLFIFHIPNDLSNVDLYNLFVVFGNVISARIMVENETGRSRGFGFVSFDNRKSAEAAIQRMNGFQIGRKRLKVQHKKEKPGAGNNSHSTMSQVAFTWAHPGVPIHLDSQVLLSHQHENQLQHHAQSGTGGSASPQGVSIVGPGAPVGSAYGNINNSQLSMGLPPHHQHITRNGDSNGGLIGIHGSGHQKRGRRRGDRVNNQGRINGSGQRMSSRGGSGKGQYHHTSSRTRNSSTAQAASSSLVESMATLHIGDSLVQPSLQPTENSEEHQVSDPAAYRVEAPFPYHHEGSLPGHTVENDTWFSNAKLPSSPSGSILTSLSSDLLASLDMSNNNVGATVGFPEQPKLDAGLTDEDTAQRQIIELQMRIKEQHELLQGQSELLQQLLSQQKQQNGAYLHPGFQ